MSLVDIYSSEGDSQRKDGWAESLISRLPNKSADIFNANFKCGSFYLIFSLFKLLTTKSLQNTTLKKL
jgi:hypothetical protein